MVISSFIKKGLLFYLLLLLSSSIAYSQNYSSSDYRRFSLTLNNGASFGDSNRGEHFLSSNFSTNTKDTYTFGLGIQYALTPAWSLELGYQRAHIIGQTDPFETKMNMVSLRNIINLNQVFLINLISNRVNPFLTLGVGYDMYNYEDPDESLYNHNSSYNLGGGIAYKLSNTVDLVALYDYHLGSNQTDNSNEGWGTDLINSLTAGIRINFGKNPQTHASWRPFPVSLSPSDYEYLMAQGGRITKLGDQVGSLEVDHETTKERLDSTIVGNRAEFDGLNIRMDLLEQRMDDLELALANLEGEINVVTVDKETGIAELLPGGHYVQIFAANHLSAAQQVRNHAISHLQDSLPDAEEKIFIIRRKQFFEVLIGVLTKFDDASNIKEVMAGFHKDTYVISFPRPVNLNMDFEGLRVVH